MNPSERLREQARAKNKEALQLWQRAQETDDAEQQAQQAPVPLPAPAAGSSQDDVNAAVAAEIAYSRSIGLPIVPEGYAGFGLFQLPTSTPAVGSTQSSVR